MLNRYIENFTDRQEAIALFERVLADISNDPQLAPILAFIGPAGSGKSMLIDYLCTQCCYSGGNILHPHAHLDFTLPGTPKDLLTILTSLRNDLFHCKDQQGKCLVFPRFDFGASFVLSAKDNTSQLNSDDLPEITTAWNDRLGELGEFLDTFENYGTAPFVFVAKKTIRATGISAAVKRRVVGPGWQWYRDNGETIGLLKSAEFEEVIRQLYQASIPGKPLRKKIERLLSQAFLADLREAFPLSGTPKAWNPQSRVVVFLDGFEVLLEDVYKTGIPLLSALATSESRKRGETDPLLLVIGSQKTVFDNQDISETSVLLNAQNPYDTWKQRLPPLDQRDRLNLRDLYLPISLHNFEQADATTYLDRFAQHYQTIELSDPDLKQKIWDFAHGHPLSLALAAAAVHDARGQNITDWFGEMPVSDIIEPDYQDQTIKHRLSQIYFGKLPQPENDLMRCAAPRALDNQILQVILKPLQGPMNRARWESYSQLAFARHLQGKLVFYANVRSLLLSKLEQSDSDDYQNTHTLLRDYFGDHHEDARIQEKERNLGWIEQAYHALALGEPQIAIEAGCYLLRYDLSLWKLLLEAVGQAPTKCRAADIQQEAANALKKAQQPGSMEDCVRAVILYIWCLVKSEKKNQEKASLWREMGQAYKNLADRGYGDKEDNQQAALSCYEEANRILDSIIDQRPVQPPVPSPTPPPPPPLSSSGQRRTRWAFVFMLVSIVALTVILFLQIRPLLISRLPVSTPKPACVQYGPPAASASTKYIGTLQSTPTETFGISDGRFVLGITGANADAKCLAAHELMQNPGINTNILSLWDQALQQEPNDAEVLIDRENRYALQSTTHISIIVFTALSDGNAGRDMLQGAYIAQKDYNLDSSTPVVLLIANFNSNINSQGNGLAMARQIVQAAHADSTVKGIVIGSSVTSLASYPQILQTLNQLPGVPIISSTGCTTCNEPAEVFHIAPRIQQEGAIGADYVENTIQAKRVAILSANDAYGTALKTGFRQQLGADRVVYDNSYKPDDKGATPASIITEALSTNPDLIYVAGNSAAADSVLTKVHSPENRGKNIQVMGGDALYQLGHYSAGNFSNFYFTSFAYPDEWIAQKPPLPQPKFSYEYPDTFDALPSDTSSGFSRGSYGYRRADADTLLAYDATSVLLQAIERAPHKTGMAPDGKVIEVTLGSTTFSAFSGQISLKDRGNPINKAIVILHVNDSGHIQQVDIKGQF